MKTITVSLGSRSYPICIQPGILDSAGTLIADAMGECKAAVITDDHVAPLYLERVMASLKAAGIEAVSITLPNGEPTKCLAQLTNLYGFLSENRITRRDIIVALGGGVIGDLSGFAAATWLRGIRFVQIPTTLLAQVDSSVGGKVAVDLPQGKNLVGAFWQPTLVLCDPQTLTTLTDAYWHDGLGEVVKYGCINDPALFALLESCAPGGREAVMAQMDEILRHCIQAKADVVAQDENDTGLRITLNFGHTAAHAIEKCEHYTGYRHGEAVAVGMAVITRISEQKGITAAGTTDRLLSLLRALELPEKLPAVPEGDLLAAMTMDKKNLGATLRVVVLDEIGRCHVENTTPDFFAGMCG